MANALAKSSLSKKVYTQQIEDLRGQIRERIEAFAGVSGGMAQTPVPHLNMAVTTMPLPPTAFIYEPSLCICVSGTKEVVIGGKHFSYDENHFLVNCVDVPTIVSIPKANQKKPYAALQLILNLDWTRDLISKMEVAGTTTDSAEPGIAIHPLTPQLLELVLRLVSLVDQPQDIPILNESIHKEIVYRLLKGPAGNRLKQIALNGSLGNRTAKAVTWLRQNFAKPASIEDLAKISGMGVSTFHRHFRDLTTLSPLQYQKRLRLHEARRLMLTEGLDAASTALQVGYESVTQFTREYRRLFGQPPARDTKHLLKTEAPKEANSSF